ncbi:MAG: ThiF family adenylyltransferase [Bacteroidota bacterium]
MIDFDSLLKDVVKVETCSVISYDDAVLLPYNFHKNGIVWEIQTEVFSKGKNRDVRFYLSLPLDLPDDFPIIFINEDDYNEIKYIPHIDENHLICIFDKGRNLVMQKDNLSDFILFIISKAKKLINDAEDENYKAQEFQREFKAYWELRYSKDDIISSSGLQSISGNADIKAVHFSQPLIGYEYFLYDDENDLKKIKQFATSLGIKCEEAGVVLIDKKFEEPPFDVNFLESFELIKKTESAYEEFKKLISTYPPDSVIVVFRNTVGNTQEYYGWTYKNAKMLPRKLSGIRANSQLEYLKNPLVASSNVLRLTFENLNLERLQIRTSGYIETQKSIVLSGVGSIGSNLLFWLKNLPINKFHFIDDESLSIENIKRHFLGFSMIAQKKAEAAATQMVYDFPLADVAVKIESVKDVVNNSVEFINECDYHIVAIGSSMIEEFILNNLISGKLTKPTIIFWVEPYLASGQMLFIKPEDAEKALKLIQAENYPFSVLKNTSEQSDKAYLIEGSCQTGYFPYSSSNVVHFLSAIFPILKEYILGKKDASAVYSWIGDKDLINDRQLLISTFAEQNESFSLIENNIK